MDVTLSMMSMFGLIALSGVVVNDSLVMVTFINQKRAKHVALHTAVSEAGVSRFRPILLTSLTTFIGLAPLMFERSFDAEFLLPMAVSLAYGVLFATFITLVLVPIEYLILDDVQRGMHRLFGRDSANDVPSLGEPHTFGG
jgi:multidrug efflux pump subunit AcrB